MFVSEYDPVARREVFRRIDRSEPFVLPQPVKKTETALNRVLKRLKNLFGAEETVLLAVLCFAYFHADQPDYLLIGALVVLLFFGDGAFVF